MTNQNQKLVTILLLASILGIALISVSYLKNKGLFGGASLVSDNELNLPVATTTRHVLIPSSVTAVVATNTSRSWIHLSNQATSSAQTVWISCGGDPSIGGIPLYATSTGLLSEFVFGKENLCKHAIYGIASTTGFSNPSNSVPIYFQEH